MANKNPYFLTGMERKSLWLLWIVLMILVAVAATSCSKKVYIPVETINEKIVFKTDTLRQMTVRYDSIYLRDSVALIMRNDTVFLTKYKDQVKYLYRTDTIHHTSTDSINVYIEKPVPYEVEKIVYVDKPLKWWQKTLMWMGVLVLILIGYLIYRVAKKAKL